MEQQPERRIEALVATEGRKHGDLIGRSARAGRPRKGDAK